MGLEILCEYCRNGFGWSTENRSNFLIKINHHVHPADIGQGDLFYFLPMALLLIPTNSSIIVRSRRGFELVFPINLYRIYCPQPGVSFNGGALLSVLWILSFYKPLPRYLHSNGSITPLSTCSELSILLIYY